MGNVQSFDPIIDENSRVLILGTLPGTKSVQEQQYYANTQNKFWTIIYGIFGTQPDATYEERVEFIRRKGIALWDVLREGIREGSSDRKITRSEQNNFRDLLEKHTNIERICFNGEEAEEFFKRSVTLPSDRHIELLPLPSTSSAHSIKTERKVEAWRAIRKYID